MTIVNNEWTELDKRRGTISNPSNIYNLLVNNLKNDLEAYIVPPNGTLSISSAEALYARLDAESVEITVKITVVEFNDVASVDKYILPVAKENRLGGIKVGNNLEITEDGTLSSSASELEPATINKLGGVKVGDGLVVASDGTLSTQAKELQPATKYKLGGIRAGDDFDIADDGTLSLGSALSEKIDNLGDKVIDVDGNSVTVTPIAGGYIWVGE